MENIRTQRKAQHDIPPPSFVDFILLVTFPNRAGAGNEGSGIPRLAAHFY